MYTAIIGLIILVCVLLILIVLVQNSKGGGLAAGFSSSNQVMGVRRTTDVVEKATWIFATSLVVLSVVASVFIPRDEVQLESKVKEESGISTQFDQALPQAQPAGNAAPIGQPTDPSAEPTEQIALPVEETSTPE